MLPRVESPIPDTIGLGTIITAAGAGGILLLVLAIMLRLPDKQRDTWGRHGIAGGFIVGLAGYLIALLVQLFCRQ